MTTIMKTTEAAEMTRHAIEFERKLIAEWLKLRITPHDLHLLKSGQYKQQLANPADCPHIMSVTIFYRLDRAATREQPAEYAAKACCDECGEWMEVEDIPEGTERNEDHGDKFRRLARMVAE